MKTLLEPCDGGSPTPSGIAYVWVAGILACLTSFPALFTRGLIGDDWSSYYVFWTEGSRGFVHWMFELAHIGYSIPMLLFSYLGEDTPNVIARIVGLTCHCLNGLLLYRVLNQSAYTRPVAALTTALFLMTPFYAIRLTLNAAYDFFLVFYLLSYVLMNSTSRSLRGWRQSACFSRSRWKRCWRLNRFVCCSSAIPGNHGERGSPG